tara:strand:+ start:828 stop:1142 length:315 start_codon:yes stop_codon:yes gene_type:complete
MSRYNKDIELDKLASENGLVDTKGLATLTTLSPKQIGRMRGEGLPFLQIGRLIKFHPRTVIKWLTKQYQPKTSPKDLIDKKDNSKADDQKNQEKDDGEEPEFSF